MHFLWLRNNFSMKKHEANMSNDTNEFKNLFFKNQEFIVRLTEKVHLIFCNRQIVRITRRIIY